MRDIAIEILYTLIILLMLYGFITALTFVLYFSSRGHIDTYQDSSYFSNTKPEYYLYGRGAGLVVRGRELLASDKKQIIFFGASTTVEGFRPEVINEHDSTVVVHNCAIGASNITEIEDVIDLILESTEYAEREKLHLVIGISYVLLRPDSELWPAGKTNIQAEMMRYGIYNHHNKRNLSNIETETLVNILRPVLLIDSIIHRMILDPVFNIALYINNKWLRPMNFLITDNLNDVVVTEDYKNYVERVMHKRMGTEDDTIQTEQFNKLIEIARKTYTNNIQLTLVDLPVPQWHMSRSKHFSHYQKMKVDYFNLLKTSFNTNLIDMQFMNDDLDFYDFAHPKPMTSIKWSNFIGKKLLINNSDDQIMSL